MALCKFCGTEIKKERKATPSGERYTTKRSNYCSNKCRASAITKYGTLTDIRAEEVWKRILEREGPYSQERQQITSAADWWRNGI